MSLILAHSRHGARHSRGALLTRSWRRRGIGGTCLPGPPIGRVGVATGLRAPAQSILAIRAWDESVAAAELIL